MRPFSARRAAVIALTVAAATLAGPASALAAGPHPMLVHASILGSIFGGIGHAVLGAFTWTIKLASTFILDTLGALVRLLIPRSWAHKGAQIMGWIVAVPEYAGKITSPGGQHRYGFAGINDLRGLFMWLGVALAPLTLTHATARAMIGDAESDPIGIPLLRIVFAGGLILLYPYLWAQGAALADQITHVILSLPDVTSGLQKLMDYAVDGVALGGWQLIDLGLMGAIGVELLGLIFLKVVLILLGALLYATGPLMIGLVPTRFGHAIARAWASAVIFLLAIGVAWATIFAVGALLIEDAGTAGPLIGGNSAFGGLVGGLILAVAGLVSLWLCLKLAKEAGGILRMQLGGLLALGALGSSRSSSGGRASTQTQTTISSLRSFRSRLAAGAGAAGSELATSVPGGRQARLALAGAGNVGRRGLAGTAAAGARDAGAQAAAPAAALIGRSRAGQVAVRMAKAGTAGYTNHNAAIPRPDDATVAATGAVNGHSVRPTARQSPRKPRPGAAGPRSHSSGPPRQTASANQSAARSGATIAPAVDASRTPHDRASGPGRLDAPVDARRTVTDRGGRVPPNASAAGARTSWPAAGPLGAASQDRGRPPVADIGRSSSRSSTPPPPPPIRRKRKTGISRAAREPVPTNGAGRPSTDRAAKPGSPSASTTPAGARSMPHVPPAAPTPDGGRK
jgi:hypothetical protein